MEESSQSRPRRLDIYLADLHQRVGSVQYGYRPVVIMQNDMGNESSATVIVIPITSKTKRQIHTHVTLGVDAGLKQTSTALCEQIQTIDMRQLRKKIGRVSTPQDVVALEKATCIALGLENLSRHDE